MMKELGPSARALLEQASAAHAPPPGAKARVLERVQASAAAGASPSVDASGASSGWLAGGAAALGAGALALLLIQPEATTPVEVTPLELGSPRFEQVRIETAEAREEAVVARPRVRPRRAAPAPVPPPVRVEAPVERPEEAATAPEPALDLAAEARILARARAALRDGRAEAALEASREHGARFPSGALREERMATEALAACALGLRDEAQKLSAELARTSPASAYLARIRAACAD